MMHDALCFQYNFLVCGTQTSLPLAACCWRYSFSSIVFRRNLWFCRLLRTKPAMNGDMMKRTKGIASASNSRPAMISGV